jgi:hypothetical protein
MPRPTEVHERLHALAGDWEGDEIMFPSPFDPAGGKAKGCVRARMQLGGFYLIADYEQSIDGRPNFQGHGVYGWDPRGRCYTLHWFDSSGIEHGAPALGTWENDTLVLQYELTQFGFSRQIYTVAAGEYLLTLQNSRDGKEWSTFLEGRYRRV